MPITNLEICKNKQGEEVFVSLQVNGRQIQKTGHKNQYIVQYFSFLLHVNLGEMCRGSSPTHFCLWPTCTDKMDWSRLHHFFDTADSLQAERYGGRERSPEYKEGPFTGSKAGSLKKKPSVPTSILCNVFLFIAPYFLLCALAFSPPPFPPFLWAYYTKPTLFKTTFSSSCIIAAHFYLMNVCPVLPSSYFL